MNTSNLTTWLFACCGMVITGTLLLAQEANKSQTPSAMVGSAPLGSRPSQVSLFLGGGDKSRAGRELAGKLGVTPYSTNQVITLEQFTKIAVAALKREGREVAPDRDIATNIELGSGNFTIHMYALQKESCFVSFDSSGRITRVGGAKGFHGEGAWQREYKGGHPVSQAK